MRRGRGAQRWLSRARLDGSAACAAAGTARAHHAIGVGTCDRCDCRTFYDDRPSTPADLGAFALVVLVVAGAVLYLAPLLVFMLARSGLP